ncbi:MAG: hypothetical protein KTR20_09885 [Cellvibrionaceae bacterium]|nr:hypothetical protein [Cellvibrionaceae bacterium]
MKVKEAKKKNTIKNKNLPYYDEKNGIKKANKKRENSKLVATVKVIL